MTREGLQSGPRCMDSELENWDSGLGFNFFLARKQLCYRPQGSLKGDEGCQGSQENRLQP